MLGSKKGINATGAARIASLLGAPLRVTNLHESNARQYTTLPACLQQSCWLRPIGPTADAACKEYLIRGLVSKNLVAWRRHFGRRLTVLRLEDVFSNLTRTAHVLAAMVGVPMPTAEWQQQALSQLLAKDGCFHHCQTAKVNQTEHLHVMNAAAERKLVAFYAADQAALRRLEPSMRWPRFDTERARTKSSEASMGLDEGEESRSSSRLALTWRMHGGGPVITGEMSPGFAGKVQSGRVYS